MNIKEEMLHHIFPGISSTGIMLTLGEHFLYSVATGVVIYIITHAISFVINQIMKKIKCGKSE